MRKMQAIMTGHILVDMVAMMTMGKGATQSARGPPRLLHHQRMIVAQLLDTKTDAVMMSPGQPIAIVVMPMMASVHQHMVSVRQHMVSVHTKTGVGMRAVGRHTKTMPLGMKTTGRRMLTIGSLTKIVRTRTGVGMRAVGRHTKTKPLGMKIAGHLMLTAGSLTKTSRQHTANAAQHYLIAGLHMMTAVVLAACQVRRPRPSLPPSLGHRADALAHLLALHVEIEHLAAAGVAQTRVHAKRLLRTRLPGPIIRRQPAP